MTESHLAWHPFSSLRCTCPEYRRDRLRHCLCFLILFCLIALEMKHML